jgi:heptaprenyl diphosphate synthase
VAALIVQNYSIFYYIPVLLISGTITGLLIGIISQELILRVKFQF